MDKLSTEILLIIFRNLHFEEKLECMLVCRAWANLLRDGYLFETIVVSNETTFEASNKYLMRLLKKAKSGTCPGKRCTTLQLHNYTDGNVKCDALATSFPNLKFLYYHSTLSYTQEHHRPRPSTSGYDPFQGWRSSLETLVDRDCTTDFVSKLLATGIFKNLTTLEVKPPYIQKDWHYSHFFSALKNAPALTTLVTEFYAPSIRCLEELHKNAPELTSLTLDYTFNAGDNALNPLEILPAKKLKKFRMTSIPALIERQHAYLTYIKLKYTHLDEFHFHVDNLWNVLLEFPSSSWGELSSMIGPGLTKLTIDSYKYALEFSDTMLQYANQLESLSLGIINNFDSLKKVLQNEQLHGLRSLSLPELPSGGCDLAYLKGLRNLKELLLGSPGDDVPLSEIIIEDIIDKLPKSIKTLNIKNINLKISRRKVEVHSNIINLKLYNTFCDDKYLSDILSQHFPKLNYLVLDNCDLYDLLELPNHRLRYLEYRPARIQRSNAVKYTSRSIGKPDKHIIHLELKTSNKTSYYNIPVRENDSFDYVTYQVGTTDNYEPLRELKPCKKTRGLKYFQFKCVYVESLCFKDCYSPDQNN